MNSYAVSEWLESLRRLERIDAAVIVPGQGPALRDRAYLRDTRELYETLIAGTRLALENGAVTLDELVAAIDLSDVRRRLAGDDPDLGATFDAIARSLIRKAAQEARDGITPPG